MTSHHILFTRPLSLQYDGAPVLRVDGQLDGYVSGQAYEGRLQIVNNIGDCTVEWVSGTMPPGTYVRVDNDTYEVVVAWPDHHVPDPDTTVVPNGSFEDGDVQWEKGAGWLVGTGSGFDTYDGAWSAAYTGRGISSLTATKVPVIPGTSITATVQIQQGASSKGNVVARILLVWFGSDGQMLPGGEGHSWNGGNLVRSGSNGAWHPSTVTAPAPQQAAFVALAVSANRKRQNRRLWADKATWNHSYPTGTNSDDDFCLVLRVRDSAGREATWQGCVGEQAIYLTSKPYAIEVMEYGTAQQEFIAATVKTPPAAEAIDYGSASVGFVNVTIRTPLQTFQVLESGSATVAFGSVTLRTTLRTYVAPVENATATPALVGITLKQVLVSVSQPVENATATPALVGVTIA
ncbi:tail fiber protein [Xanthomonas phage JUN5]|nr:tail fiber protein [Xanthomonas phage JUN5]